MRVSWIIFTALCTVVLFAITVKPGTVYFASGSGPGVAEPDLATPATAGDPC